jgi:hypothetical protein
MKRVIAIGILILPPAFGNRAADLTSPSAPAA